MFYVYHDDPQQLQFFEQLFKYFAYIYVSQKKECDQQRLPQTCTFLCNSPGRMLFYQYFWGFFWYSKCPKTNPQNFFLSQNLKFRKAKMCISESQKIRKILIRNFAIFSSGLIFKEKLFFLRLLSFQLNSVYL